MPFRTAPSHLGGLAIIIHHYPGLPVGVFVLLANVFLYSLAVDLLAPWFPTNLTQDPLLATVCRGILMGGRGCTPGRNGRYTSAW